MESTAVGDDRGNVCPVEETIHPRLMSVDWPILDFSKVSKQWPPSSDSKRGWGYIGESNKQEAPRVGRAAIASSSGAFGGRDMGWVISCLLFVCTLATQR